MQVGSGFNVSSVSYITKPGNLGGELLRLFADEAFAQTEIMTTDDKAASLPAGGEKESVAFHAAFGPQLQGLHLRRYPRPQSLLTRVNA